MDREVIIPALWGRVSRPIEDMVTSLWSCAPGIPVATNMSPKFWRAMFIPEEEEPQIPAQTLVMSTMVKALTPRE